ncbi:hypothetical protein GCM10025770_38300 [Viridibacterium curvum]|uniref:Uncharacterized protein n=1 Tax=Viridibacterium curvum TaxID=1101404 RepID=A0ABP9R774_9RHOO
MRPTKPNAVETGYAASFSRSTYGFCVIENGMGGLHSIAAVERDRFVVFQALSAQLKLSKTEEDQQQCATAKN